MKSCRRQHDTIAKMFEQTTLMSGGYGGNMGKVHPGNDNTKPAYNIEWPPPKNIL